MAAPTEWDDEHPDSVLPSHPQTGSGTRFPMESPGVVLLRNRLNFGLKSVIKAN